MKTWLSQTVLIGATSIMLILFLMTLGSAHQETILGACAAVIILLSVGIERFNPFLKKWNQADGDLFGDISLFVSIFAVLDGVLKWLSPFVLLWILGEWSTGLITLPLWAQTVLVGLLIELGAYVSHRAHHLIKFLWPLHAMHHSPARLYTLNNFRFHPLNHVINYLFMIVPVLLLGFSPQAILAYTAISMPVLLVQHANIDFHFGWFNTIINTNEVHRWHHSNQALEGNANYGRATLIWDRIFGTYYFPKMKAPGTIGLYATSKNFPPARKTLAQIWFPFTRDCCS